MLTFNQYSLGIFCMLFSLLFACDSPKEVERNYRSENLKIKALTEHSFVHVSYLPTKNFGKVACNGLVFVSDGEAIIFDTPANDKVAKELIDWVQTEMKAKIVAVVINHFHVDCLGGLQAFHDLGIPSYANQTTIALAKQDSVTVPQIGFEKRQNIKVGTKTVLNEYFGEGHTVDNIVSYIPSEEVLFGGCMIKSLKAKKGNLADANVEEWSNTVQAVKNNFPQLKFIVPGHGKSGGTELLDYTIALFQPE